MILFAFPQIILPQETGKAPRLEKGKSLPVIQGRSRSLGLSVNRRNKKEVQDFFQNVYLPASTAQNEWSGSVKGCRPGKNSASFQKATEKMINYFRAMAGLPGDVTLDSELDRRAIEGALIFKAQGSLSHTPPKSWRCWSSTGKTAAGKSNISLGSAGPSAIVSYIKDDGSNNKEVGHRRWILHPAQKIMGSGSTDSTNALWVFGGFKKQKPEIPGGIAWPPAGYVPYLFGLSSDYRWSFSFPDADFKRSKVTVSYQNKRLRIRQEKPYNGYGENTLVWNVKGLPGGRPKDEVSVDVVIKNVVVKGKSLTFRYTVRFIAPGTISSSRSRKSYNLTAGMHLIMAAQSGKVSEGEIALDSGADVNALHKGWTPLMIAANNGKEDFVDFLLENHADLNVALDGQWTALRLAESRRHTRIAKKLKERGAQDIRSRSADSGIPEPPEFK